MCVREREIERGREKEIERGRETKFLPSLVGVLLSYDNCSLPLL